MANNTLLASDSFASGSLAAGWSAVPGQSVCQVVAGPPNFTEANSLLTVAGQLWTGLTWPNDHISEITVTMTGSAVATTLIHLHVRNQGGGSYSGYRAIIKDSGAWEIDVVTAGTPTSLISGTGLAIGANDIWSFGAFGSCLALYQNFKRIGYIGDATYTGGSPGYSQEATTTLSTNKVFAWRGYSAVQQDGIWAKQGVIFPATANQVANAGHFGTGVTGPQGVLYEGNAQILTGNVYKCWFTDGYIDGVGYAESSDGKSWTPYASNPVIANYANGAVYKYNGAFYHWGQKSTEIGTGHPYMFTSADGITWGAGTVTDLPTSATYTNVYYLVIADNIAGTWYALFSALNGTGNAPNTYLATSADGLAWTVQNSGNAVLANVFGMDASIVKLVVSGTLTYFMWGTANQVGQQNPTSPGFDPLETVLYSSTNLTNWTFVHHSIHASGMWESLNSKEAGAYASSIVQMPTMGRVGMYYVGSPGDSTPPTVYQGGLALAPANSTIAEIVATNEDASVQVATDSFTSGIGDLSANWTTPTGWHKLQIVAGNLVEASLANTGCGMYYSGASFNPVTATMGQYSEITLATLSGTANQYACGPGVLIQTGSRAGYYIQIIGPTGTGVTAASNNVFIYSQDGSGSYINKSPSVQFTPHTTDVFRLSIIQGPDGNNVLTMYQNGFTLMVWEDYANTYTSGSPGMSMYALSTLANAQISRWAGGNANVIPNYPSVLFPPFFGR